jgi:hypothetical protein
MSKVRINDLARELEVKSRAILDALTHVGVTEKKTHSSSLEGDEAERVRQYFHRSGGKNGAGAAKADSEPKQKIDWSRVSKPGDVLKAIQQRRSRRRSATAAGSPDRSAAGQQANGSRGRRECPRRVCTAALIAASSRAQPGGQRVTSRCARAIGAILHGLWPGCARAGSAEYFGTERARIKRQWIRHGWTGATTLHAPAACAQTDCPPATPGATDRGGCAAHTCHCG